MEAKRVEYKGYMLYVERVNPVYHVWAYKIGSTDLQFITAHPTANDAVARGKKILDAIIKGELI